jgi:NAD(P)-dependent dehydrogenase (short-subunit alcohol dehydrogenase family)
VEVGGSALVTGASRGIGRAVALELARRGFSVVATMRDPTAGDDLVEEATRAGGALRVERLDVTDPGRIAVPDDLRVLVNNAGIQEGYLPVEAVALDVVRSLLETNVIGQIAVLQQVLPVFRCQGEGVVCMITSAGILWPTPFFGAYRASKAAASALCESLVLELAPFGIRVVEVLPGPVDTDGLAGSAFIPAVHLEPYRVQAQRMMDSRGRIAAATVSAASAASRIVDTILDDSVPLRSGSDPMGDALLESWRRSSDIERLAEAREHYLGAEPPPTSG